MSINIQSELKKFIIKGKKRLITGKFLYVASKVLVINRAVKF